MEMRSRFMTQQFQQQQNNNTPPGFMMAMQRYGNALDVPALPGSSSMPEPVHYYQENYQEPQLSDSPHPGYVANANSHDSSSSEEQRKLAAAMGAAGLRSIVHNGRVIKDYMTVPFTQRWRKRPYGYSNSSLPHPQSPAP